MTEMCIDYLMQNLCCMTKCEFIMVLTPLCIELENFMNKNKELLFNVIYQALLGLLKTVLYKLGQCAPSVVACCWIYLWSTVHAVNNVDINFSSLQWQRL